MVVVKRSVGSDEIVGVSNRCRKSNCICGQAGGQGFDAEPKIAPREEKAKEKGGELV